MDNNMSEMINNVKKMVDSGNLPPDIQNLVNNKSSNNNFDSNNNNNNNNNSVDFNDMLNKIPPDLMKNLSNMLNSSDNVGTSNSSSSSDSNNVNNFNIDINTMLKMKSIIENMNNKNDPRANLLYSLKPYLRDNKKNKLDQYVNLLNMTKVADIMKNENNTDKK